jgi:lipoprotein-releasing system permease protein
VSYELRIALRYLTARRKQAFISVISAISVLGVAVGVMALMIALGLMTGLQGEIRSRILGTTAHVYVFKAEVGSIEDYRRVVTTINGLAGVTGAAPVVYGKAMISSRARSAFVTVKGVDPRGERTVTELAHQIEGGRLEDLVPAGDGPPPILLGRDLATNLLVEVGDPVAILVPEGRLSPVGMLPGRSRFRVAGIVRTGLFEFDSEWAYVSLGQAQRLFEHGEDRAGQVEVRLADIFAVGDAGRRIRQALGEGYLTHDWIQLNENLFAALWLEKVAIAITIGLIVMVAALNIIATLILMVMEKHKDVAVLVSMGAARGAIARIFVLQGCIIGAVGTAVGGALGWAACALLDRYHLIRIPADVYQVSYVPFKLQPLDAGIVILGAMLICLLATIYPAYGAARLDPAEAIRYE